MNLKQENPLNQNPIRELSLFEQVLDRDNLARALKQVQRNKGAAGIDGMTVNQLPEFLKQHWSTVRRKLETSTYVPTPVKRVEIPKPDGRKRQLGIPTVLDRFIQQAIAQVLSKHWDLKFHSNSYGFRPRRNAHQAVRHLQGNIKDGYRWMVDCDLEAFFDQVNHDLLMSRLKLAHQDEALLRLINRYLKAGVKVGSDTLPSTRGVPQGGPLSPVLSNILLNDLDWEIDRRGHPFARYADDFVVLTRSKAAGERVMASLQRYLRDSLKLKVNIAKSAVDRPWYRTFLGFTFLKRDGRIKVADSAYLKLKATIRGVTRRTRGHTLRHIIEDLKKSLLGWRAYFGITEVLSPLREIDKWLRRRLRCYIWKQWGRSGYRQLRARGIERYLAWNTAKSAHGPWRLSASPALDQALPNKYFRNLGLPSLATG